MKVKRFIAGVIAAVIGFVGSYGSAGLLPDIVRASAEGARGGGISASKTSVGNGDTFDVTVTVPAISEKADTATVRVEFDATAFEIVSWAPTLTGANPLINYSNDTGFFLIVSSSAGRNIDLSSGASFTATMRTKSGAKQGTYTFSLSTATFSYVGSDGKTSYQLWTPTSTRATVGIAASPVSGKITAAGVGGTASVVLRDLNGAVVGSTRCTLKYSSATGKYTGNYSFSDARSGYTVEVTLSGCPVHIYTVGSSSSADIDMRIYGDVDGNGVIEAIDATQILRYIVGMTSWIKGSDGVTNDYILSVAKVSKGGDLTEKDATLILRHVAGISSIV